ncbi:MAG: transketolase [Spirochaetaceae bacterium]|nr:MAG: transketolase [Spirochaetaceae bacterium]
MKENLAASALTIRALSADAIEKAQSGHPGLPLGCAELGALIYGEILKHNPADPQWINRDRFILSAGHGSMLLYSLLFLTGYDLTLTDIKAFRQLGSKTPGHPERGTTAGVETTTGPLGQGFGNAVGIAIAERMLASRFNTAEHRIMDHFTYVLASDGDLMEGVCYEAVSLAGHLGLGKLIVFYDSNSISIDGSTELAFSDHVPGRFQACNWQVLQGDAYDLDGILDLVDQAKNDTDKPSLIVLQSQIGKGAPKLAGSHQVHGGALGREEVEGLKRSLGVKGEFFVSPQALAYFAERGKAWSEHYDRWQALFADWRQKNPNLYDELRGLENAQKGPTAELGLPNFKIGDSPATRVAGGKILDSLVEQRPELVGGCADLTVPCFGTTPQLTAFSRDNPCGRFLYYGVREHAMGSISNGIALHSMLRPFCATFMAFSDYMRPAIRLAALMKLPVIYIMSHDSVKIGEDGPTHQPVEHLAALRAIPGLMVLRPADAQETVEAWKLALERTGGPTVIALTRFGIEVFPKADPNWRDSFRRGAYLVKDCGGNPDLVIIATGSEVHEALEVCPAYGDKKIRVVSMPCRELFLSQDIEFRTSLIPQKADRIVIEAGVAQGWQALFSENCSILSIERFGLSAPGQRAASALGIDSDRLSAMIHSIIKRNKQP